MERKYLPIGTICTIKGQNKKVMITGFYSPKFNGNMKINDYVGCFYPEGMLIPEGVISFNHSEIDNIDYLGYKDEENEKFQRLLDQVTGNVLENDKTDVAQTVSNTGIFSKIVFDENGVVTLAEPVDNSKNTSEEDNSSFFSNIEFDENGYVIRADSKSVDNPFHKEYAVDKKQKEVPENKWKIFDKIEFDENGTVISTSLLDDEKKSSLVDVKFDDDGDVLEELDKTQELPKLDNIVFDDNGMIVEANGIKYAA